MASKVFLSIYKTEAKIQNAKNFLFNQTDNIDNIGVKEEVGYKTINPVRFEIGETNRKYLVFTEPYSEDWKLDGKGPVRAYGAVNAFENGVKEIRFERFYRVNLPAYIISILTFAGLIAVYLGSRRKKKKMIM